MTLLLFVIFSSLTGPVLSISSIFSFLLKSALLDGVSERLENISKGEIKINFKVISLKGL
jgi:hypothetical protein